MLYKPYKDIKLSHLGMGCMRLPTQGGERGAPIDREKAQEIIDYAMANGINYFDTSFVYHGGESEKFLGDALAGYPRESYNLATKFFILASEDYKAVFEEQLERLKTDYIDFYLIHGIFDHTYQQYIDGGAVEYFAEQQAKGRIRHLGFSAHVNTENFTKFVNHRDWDFTMIPLNSYDWIYGSVKEQYEILAEKGIPVIAMNPVRGGRLAALSPDSEKMLKAARPDWSVAEWVMRWGKNRSATAVVLSGMTTIEQIKENVPIFNHGEGLSEDEELLLYKAFEAFRKDMHVPCTDCDYCIEDGTCHAGIIIPRFLDAYNTYKVDGPWSLRSISEIESEGRHTDCTACGKCAERCPQGIDIMGIMKELVELTKES